MENDSVDHDSVETLRQHLIRLFLSSMRSFVANTLNLPLITPPLTPSEVPLATAGGKNSSAPIPRRTKMEIELRMDANGRE